ncbi:MAG: trigger factor [Eubacterium sp.]|nr:trigger factor [Eubacterium sp.]
MKKKTGLAAILFGTGLCLMAGCGNNSSAGNETGESVVDTETQVFFDYNVSDYVTLGDYKNLSVQYPVPVVTDEDVEMSIEELVSDYTEYNEDANRAAQEGDYLSIDFAGTIDGEEFDGGSAEDYEFTLGEDEFPEDFEKNLIGKKAGEEVSFSMTYPADYYEETAGKTAEFKVTVKSVSEVVVPEYNDEFVAKATEYDTTEAYEQAMREELVAGAQEEASTGAGEDALALAVGNATINGYPQELYDACYDSTLEEYQSYAAMFGVEMEEFMQEFMGEDNLDSVTLDMVNEILVSQAIAEKEGFAVTEKNYAQEAQALADANGYDSLDDFTADYGKNSIMTMLVREKAVEFLYENADVQEVSEEEYYGESENEAEDDAEISDTE